jgi:hypothetical protein
VIWARAPEVDLPAPRLEVVIDDAATGECAPCALARRVELPRRTWRWIFRESGLKRASTARRSTSRRSPPSSAGPSR